MFSPPPPLKKIEKYFNLLLNAIILKEIFEVSRIKCSQNKQKKIFC